MLVIIKIWAAASVVVFIPFLVMLFYILSVVLLIMLFVLCIFMMLFIHMLHDLLRMRQTRGQSRSRFRPVIVPTRVPPTTITPKAAVITFIFNLFISDTSFSICCN